MIFPVIFRSPIIVFEDTVSVAFNNIGEGRTFGEWLCHKESIKVIKKELQ
jgi:hypothetical protein